MHNAFSRSASIAAALFALFASPSLAIADTNTALQDTPPVATGRPHRCVEYYPAEALKTHTQGNTMLAFTIGEDGIPRDVSVATSSGDSDLDQAAVTCVKTWLYIPATQNGKPIAAPWKAAVSWSVHDEPNPALERTTSVGRPHSCNGDYPAAAIENMAQGTTTLQFTIGTDGETHDVAVYVTSGNKDLDDAAIACAKHWRYKPAMQDDKPIAVPWRANVVWVMPQLSLPVGFNPLAHQCAQAFQFAESRHDSAFDLRLAFFINADGSAGAPRIVHSSQDLELDAAFVRCVGSWEYTPAKRGDTPVRVVWGALFHLGPPIGGGTREGPPHIHFCPAASAVTRIAANQTEGTTVLKFQINPWGHPDQIEIAASSGNRDLDDAAKSCAAQWTYDISGQAAPQPWSAQIGWQNYGWSFAAELGNGDEPTFTEPAVVPPARTNGGGI